MSAVPVRNLHPVIPQQSGGQETPPAEAPFQRQQHGLALHVAFFLSDHGQHEQDDIAGGVQGVQVLLLEEDLNGRIVLVLQLAYPADAIQQVPGKSRDTLGDDHVDLPGHSVFHHELEGGTVVCVGAGEPVVYLVTLHNTMPQIAKAPESPCSAGFSGALSGLSSLKKSPG